MTCSHYIEQRSSRYFLNVADDRLIMGKANQDTTLIEHAVLSPFPEFPWIAYLKKGCQSCCRMEAIWFN